MNLRKEYIREHRGEIDSKIMLYSFSAGAFAGCVSTFFCVERPNLFDCIPGLVVGQTAGVYFALSASKALEWYSR